MTANITRIRTHIQNFSFEDLFIEELGWDQYRDQLDIVVNGDTIRLHAFAEKRGMVAFTMGNIPDYGLRRKIEQQVAKIHRENIIIYADSHRGEQVWQWVRRETGKPLMNRERPYRAGSSGESITQVLSGIAFSLDEEDSLTIVDVTSRVRAAFDVEKVTKKFYDRFKKQHDAFLAFIEGIPDADFQRWYASVMLNRLMFIYFVQRKGFLDNDTDYLRNRLARTDGNFYRDFLIPLFFQGFAEKDHSAETRRLLGDVPYLNGGLFLTHPIEERYGAAIQIENEAFEKLFDFFDEYHWHLDERPLRNDNEINPDVLGYIFEKYINQKQMGAYYTKEDITEYISKNTVIPFLFDQARKAVQIAFEGDHTVWDLLADNPDRYIYPAVQHGYYEEVPRPEGEGFRVRALPEYIAAGLDDVSQRSDWNIPAPPEYALPTEIWREVVARRTRYAEVRDKLERGEVHEINNLITLNLDIQQFAQDVIAYTDSPDVVRAFWSALNRMTVLDPTCGSGAFLFAALNILEPLYEACLERMGDFLADMRRTGGHPQQYSDFHTVMERIDQHPNRRYFILKSIIVNNLFGVDIMEEAIEIAKLRLFLKLVAQVDDKDRIEPLPDIDFNIRAGNTLVGYATEAEINASMFARGVLPRIETLTGTLNTFRREQLAGNISDKQMAELKQRANKTIGEIVAVLDEALAPMHGFGTDQVERFRATHKPFHWYAEFYGVLKSGGFDVIIGNPPYVEYRLVKSDYALLNTSYKSLESNNLYAYCMERSTQLISLGGRFGMIVPTSVIGLDGTACLREVLLDSFESNLCSTYGIRPSKLFEGVDQRLCIYLGKTGTQIPSTIQTTRHHYWYSDERPNLFNSLIYNHAFNHSRLLRFPQIPNAKGRKILEKLEAQNRITIRQYYTKSAKRYLMHYHRSPRYWIRGIDFEPHFKNATRSRSIHHFRDLYFRNLAEGKVIGALLNSSLFYFWFISMGNGRNITGTDIEEFPIGELTENILSAMPPIFDRLMEDYRNNSIIRVRANQEYQEFYQSKSKPIMDEIDRVLARHYGFTDEELDFIINYDIKYRMGDDLAGDEEGEE
ncbi:MAG: Eco57I restriction-modification methylase domain-containing protein [Anaerolineae bacterium]|nr:Eco57I restriction-modification methylase domain-containing protein [Anaerolineae bacterium]